MPFPFSKRIRSILRIVSDGIVDAAWIKTVASLPVIIGVLRIGLAIIKFYCPFKKRSSHQLQKVTNKTKSMNFFH